MKIKYPFDEDDVIITEKMDGENTTTMRDKKIISFDFDSTLDNSHIQKYAMELRSRGFDLMICTSRFEPGYEHANKIFEWDSSDIFMVAEHLGIDRIIFTNMKDKSYILKDYDILFHIDDDIHEIISLHKMKINAVLFDEHWKENCEKIIQENK